MTDITKILTSIYSERDLNDIYLSGNKGYWSNLSSEDNHIFSNLLKQLSTRSAVRQIIPQFEEMIFSKKREAALDLLDHVNPGICIDYGCMWGVLSVGMAKRGHQVISVDQTYESLHFLKTRANEEQLKNIHVVQDDIKNVNFNELADYALVNGVLEWVPILEEVDVTNYYKGGTTYTSKNANPKDIQIKFLKTVLKSLKDKGKMLLAIENKHSYQYYMGRKDPHANLLFTTFVPRWIANCISFLFQKKEYRNYIYSFREIKELVLKSGFRKCKLYMAFPDYHFPEMILEYSKKGVSKYRHYPNKYRLTVKQKFAYYFEFIIHKFFRRKYFSPAIILVAEK